MENTGKKQSVDDKVVNADKTADVLNRTKTVEAHVVNVRHDIHNKYVDPNERTYDEAGNLVVIRERKLILMLDAELPIIRKKIVDGKDVYYEEKTKELVVSAYAMTQILSLLDFEFDCEMARLKEATNTETVSVRTLMFFMMKSTVNIDVTTFNVGDKYVLADGTEKQIEHKFYRSTVVNVEPDPKYYRRGLDCLTAEVDDAIADAKAL